MDNPITVSPTALTNLLTVSALLFLMPLLFVLLWKKRCGKAASLLPLFLGAAGFIVSARILELGVHMVCIVLDNPVSRFINGNTLVYVLYGASMAGIFEECGRYVVLAFLMKKKLSRENIVMYGIGHGGIEVWSVTLMSMISLLAIVLALQAGGPDALQMLGISMSDGASLAVVQAAAGFSAANGALAVIERFFCMFLHIGLTVVVGYGVMTGQKRYLPFAILAHMAIDILPALSQRAVIGVWLVEGWLFVCAVLMTLWAVLLYRKMPGSKPPKPAEANCGV